MSKRLWKYPTIVTTTHLECYDCGLEYGSHIWVDIVLPDEIWEMINPSVHEESGLLCFNCIVRRLKFLGMDEVPIYIASGPFSKRDDKPSWKD